MCLKWLRGCFGMMSKGDEGSLFGSNSVGDLLKKVICYYRSGGL